MFEQLLTVWEKRAAQQDKQLETNVTILERRKADLEEYKEQLEKEVERMKSHLTRVRILHATSKTPSLRVGEKMQHGKIAYETVTITGVDDAMSPPCYHVRTDDGRDLNTVAERLTSVRFGKEHFDEVASTGVDEDVVAAKRARTAVRALQSPPHSNHTSAQASSDVPQITTAQWKRVAGAMLPENADCILYSDGASGVIAHHSVNHSSRVYVRPIQVPTYVEGASAQRNGAT